MEDPPGGKIIRLPDGTPSGLLEEAAVFTIVHPYLMSTLDIKQKKLALRNAIRAFNRAGVTTVVDMAMDEECWNVLYEMKQDGDITLRLGAHFLILPLGSQEKNLAQVDRVIQLHKRFSKSSSPDFWIAGIKIICDGVVDGCTAAISQHYLNTKKRVDPVWALVDLQPVLYKAHAAAMQCALHAIGDAAVTLAIDGLAALEPTGRRHRIEHLELTKPEDAQRLGHLGIIASIQPVHCDPELLTVWPPLIGRKACSRAFAYREFFDHGAHIAVGTDAPTAPHLPFNNLFNAYTRRTFQRPEDLTQFNPQFALDFNDALSAQSYWSAYACFMDDVTGGLRVGKKADLIVVEGGNDWENAPESILECRTTATWLDGKQIFGSKS